VVGSFTNTLLQIYCCVGLERILKISRYLAKLSVRKLIASSTMCAGHRPAVQLWSMAIFEHTAKSVGKRILKIGQH